MENDTLYTPEEVAEILKISRYTVYELVKRGDLSAHRIGRKIRIAKTDLEQYIRSSKGLENIYEGEIILQGEAQYIKVDQIQIRVVTDHRGTVKMSIRPEDIILATQVFPSSARNALKGIVTEVWLDGPVAKITLDIGIPIIALITKQSLEDMHIQAGSEVYAIFKTTAVRIFK